MNPQFSLLEWFVADNIILIMNSGFKMGEGTEWLYVLDALGYVFEDFSRSLVAAEEPFSLTE